MDTALRAESEKLARSWMQHEPGWLRDYLVASVEDPRINLQSILSRHFLIHATTGKKFQSLMQEEYRFSAVMNWLLELAGKQADEEDLQLILYTLNRGSDNAEGIEIPRWVSHAFARLTTSSSERRISNYIESFLKGTRYQNGKAVPHAQSFDTFMCLWRSVLDDLARNQPELRLPSVFEPACGSANDYRFWAACGLAQLLEYRGIDLCPANIDNARKLCPGVAFQVGNVFELEQPEKAFDFCIVHDLFEHLSPAGMERAVHEICRVTKKGICAGFFQMDEIPEHLVRPTEDYHWNLLSLARVQQSFAGKGFVGQVLHIRSFLQYQAGCDRFHNPNAYTLELERF